MPAVLRVFAHEGLDRVLDAERLAGVVLAGLQGDGAGRGGRELEGERVRVGPQLLDEFVLHGRQLLLVVAVARGRHDLLAGQHDLLAELDAHHLVLLAAIAVGRRHLRHAKDAVRVETRLLDASTTRKPRAALDLGDYRPQKNRTVEQTASAACRRDRDWRTPPREI